ncbi:PP2C family protein-serine/threonine phosphatase [Sinomonas terrae]|uniref:Protein phosphatase 2C domain-containing protein n=1 Tax=Sinomonas terrae TaxID=2908838 RepID=A0ABS9U6G1_9MICC|nr:protein phosphatase 2C domain-containing protein [Sinomonas terrae]MCH6472276.1 protein phosphatase 2C domain-containing protein [Sinomonas terrae]
MPDTQLILRYAARSDVGRLRAKNDDSAYAGRHLAVVADGMGGHAGGDVASASTVLDLVHLDHGGYGDSGEAGTVLADEIQTANSLLSELVAANPKLAGMGTTVTAILLNGSKLAFAHIGDSRAYRLRGNKFEQMSVDHTFVQRLINEGRLRPEEAETHPHKNVLMRVLGDVDASPELDLTSFDVEEGERWLLCSDGLNYVPHPIVERTVHEIEDPGECADKLIALTLAAGAPDNVTVIVADIVAGTMVDDESGIDDEKPVAAPAAAATVTASAAARTPVTSAARAESPTGKAASGAPAGESPASAGAGAAAGSGTAAESGPGAAKGPDDPESGELGEDESARHEVPTDPNLGAHLSAEVLRRELDSRPHELVGAAAAAAESGSLPSVASRTAARRAAALLTHGAEPEPEVEETEAEADTTRRRLRRWVRIILAAVVAVAIVLGLWLGYAWTQTRYYVGAYNNHVAIFNGVSQTLGPISLSKVYTTTDITMNSLPDFQQQRLQAGVAANSLSEAQDIIANLRNNPDSCLNSPSSSSPTASATHSASASASATAIPPGHPTPSPSGSHPSSSPSSSPLPTNPCLGGQ